MRRYFKILVQIFVAALLLGALQKVLFLVAYFGRTLVLSLYELWGVFRYGALLDISLAAYIVVLPWFFGLVCLLFGLRVSARVCEYSLRCYLVFIALAVAVVGATDIKLYEHWSYRIDASLLQYLSTPAEAAASMSFFDIFSGSLWLLVTFCVALMLFRRATVGAYIDWVTGYARRSFAVVCWLFLGGVIFLGIRGGVSESTANVSKVYFCNTEFANHAAVNPTFSLLSSVDKAERFGELYRFFEEDRAEQLFYAAVSQDKFRSRGGGGTRVLRRGVSRPNVVVIIAEGFTRAIMDLDVDGRAVMPNLRRIADGGLDFTRVYAAGSRTDRGVAAVLSAFPAQPQLSIMKIPAKSRSLPSVARSLGREGYSSVFYYGGDLDFMNMSSYLYGTGWQRLVWGDAVGRRVGALESDHGRSQWGWRDEAVAEVFADDVIAMSDSGVGVPFLATWLTLSSHKPFDVGQDFGFSDPMLNSMAYSDAAVGLCVDMLRHSVAWEDLLVVIVADHTIGTFNSGLPGYSAERFHIPMVWTGGALGRSGSNGDYMSQYDFAATLLGAMGVDASDFEFSRNVYGRSYDPYGYYTFNDGFGVISAGGGVVYDNKRGAVVSGDARSRYVDVGKSILQHTHTAIDRLTP